MSGSPRLATMLATTALGLFAFASLPANANLVVNGGFETGDLTGYTLSGNSARIAVGTGVGFSGNDALGIGNSPTGYVTQALATSPGGKYVLSYVLLSPDVSGFPPGYVADEFLVNVGGDASTGTLTGGRTLFDMTNLPALPVTSPYSYQALFAHYTFDFTAASDSTNLIFGGFNNPSFFILDDVSVVAAPEPASVALLGVGLAACGLVRRRRRATAS